LDSSSTLWYTRPADDWTQAVPVGCGKLGAMIFGGPAGERIVLNEDTVWTGGPYDPSWEGGAQALPEIQRLVFEGKCFEAHELFGRKMMGIPIGQMKYQPLGNLLLDFDLPAGGVKDYRRGLDLISGLADVSFRAGGAEYRREVLASFPDSLIAIRLTADSPGRLCFTARYEGVRNDNPNPRKDGCDEQFQTVATDDGQLVLTGRCASFIGIVGRIRYESRAAFRVEGGRIAPDGDRLVVTGADAVTIVIAAATNFIRYDDISGDPAGAVAAVLSAAANKPYDELRTRAVADHRALMGRVELSLPETERSALPTDQRLVGYDGLNDPALPALLMQYGRYLLVGSSREGAQPANLQGVWNPSTNPAWSSKYTTNINLEMNYWPAEACNLTECVGPLVEMVHDLSRTGQAVARKHYGASGWVFHQNTDLWRAAAPMDGPSWGPFQVGGAWLCVHLCEHYLCTGDRDFLPRTWPVVKSSVEFFLDTLVEHPTHGWLVTCPSTSPESFPACPGNGRYRDVFVHMPQPGVTICAGPTMDMQILRDLFDACIRMGREIGGHDELLSRIEQARSRLAPMRIGRHGHLQEWIEDWEDIEPEHRHISHLYGLYPSRQITPESTPELAAAAAKSLEMRGDGTTGFSMTWKAACWARLGDGEHANRCLTNLVAEQTCVNLWSKCFRHAQVDGSFGAAAAVAEMLMQSDSPWPGEGAEIRLLPALPGAWHTGRVRGLRARGGFEVDIDWADGHVTGATVRSILGGPCRIPRCRAFRGRMRRRVGGRAGIETAGLLSTPSRAAATGCRPREATRNDLPCPGRVRPGLAFPRRVPGRFVDLAVVHQVHGR
jgi:alpha-L-fucosidase 2